MRARLFVVLFTLLLSAFSLTAQASQPSAPALPPATFDLEQNYIKAAELEGRVHFHAGDDPDGKLGWARPDFDDSKWQIVELSKYWNESGIHDPGGWKGNDGRGMAWLRFRVKLPKKHGPLAIWLRRIDSACQIYVNGQYVGQHGFMPPHEDAAMNYPFYLPLPPSLDGEVVIAMRFWHQVGWEQEAGGGLGTAPYLGDAAWLSYFYEIDYRSNVWWDAATCIMILLNLVAGLVGITLFLVRRREREYLYFGAALLLAAAADLLSTSQDFLTIPANTALYGSGILADFCGLLYLLFYYALVGARRDRWFRIAAAGWVALLLLNGVKLSHPQYATWSDMNPGWRLPESLLLMIATTLPNVIVLVRGARRRAPEAILLLIPVGFDFLVDLFHQGLYAGYRMKLFPWAGSFLGYWGWDFTDWPFPLTLPDVAGYIELLFVLLVIVLRFARAGREQERMRNEFEAARTVQQVLVPEEIPSIPGFSIQAVYHPAGEVGGDFYQVVPTPDGGLLAIIGDVSGKGMPAAMTVSLLVGAFRTLAESEYDPAAILAALNRRMIGRTNGGFATALALRLDRDGTLTAANAGHISPYANGKELEIESGLPLGIVADVGYTDSTLHLQAGTSLTLLSDGVVEAQNAKGELFGFERTAAASAEPAEKLAQAAKAFGQSDDITVLSLALVAVGS